MTMSYDVEGLLYGAQVAGEAADQIIAAKTKLRNAPAASGSLFGTFDGGSALAGAVNSAREQHTTALAVATNNIAMAGERAKRTAQLGSDLSAATVAVAGGSAAAVA